MSRKRKAPKKIAIIDPKYKLQKKMMSYVMSSFVDSDLVVYVFDSNSNKNIVGKIKDILF